MAPRADLSDVTVVAVTSVNLDATLHALTQTLEGAKAATAILFTDQAVPSLPAGIRHVPIEPLRSTGDYSRFLLHDLHRWIETPHCLVIQWDGFPVHPSNWDAAFLEYDYIGAPWPQFGDGHDVGNGGFSLRSRRLMQACLDAGFDEDGGPEDIVIARRNRAFLEREHGIRFAPKGIAARFSVERPLHRHSRHGRDLANAFGFHGVFNIVPLLGPVAFARIYRSLDHLGPVHHDLRMLVAQLLRSPAGIAVAFRLLRDAVKGRLAPTRRG